VAVLAERKSCEKDPLAETDVAIRYGGINWLGVFWTIKSRMSFHKKWKNT